MSDWTRMTNPESAPSLGAFASRTVAHVCDCPSPGHREGCVLAIRLRIKERVCHARGVISFIPPDVAQEIDELVEAALQGTLARLQQRFTDARIALLSAEQEILRTARRGALHPARLRAIARQLAAVKRLLDLPT